MEKYNKSKKREMKQFILNSKVDCIIYLQNIIMITVRCLEKHKIYLKELEKIINQYNSKDRISYKIYSDLLGKLGNEESYMLNILGDGQSSSISYFKFRKLLPKLAKNPEKNIHYYAFTEKEEDILQNFNLQRNWHNHIPESLITSDIEMIKRGFSNVYVDTPIEVIMYNYVTYEFINDLLVRSSTFHSNAKKMLQCAKKDYSLLIGKSVTVRKVYIDEPKSIENMYQVNMSAYIQGLSN